MVARTKAQQELVETVGSLIDTRLELQYFFEECVKTWGAEAMKPDFLARLIVHDYHVRRR